MCVHKRAVAVSVQTGSYNYLKSIFKNKTGMVVGIIESYLGWDQADSEHRGNTSDSIRECSMSQAQIELVLWLFLLDEGCPKPLAVFLTSQIQFVFPILLQV